MEKTISLLKKKDIYPFGIPFRAEKHTPSTTPLIEESRMEKTISLLQNRNTNPLGASLKPNSGRKYTIVSVCIFSGLQSVKF